jgi:hypothetical protein
MAFGRFWLSGQGGAANRIPGRPIAFMRFAAGFYRGAPLEARTIPEYNR